MQALMAEERGLGYDPKDVSKETLGWDIKSAIPGDGQLSFIEARGRVRGVRTVTVTENEILSALNKPEDSTLAIVKVKLYAPSEGTIEPSGAEVRYLHTPFQRDPDFAVTSLNYSITQLLKQGDVSNER